MRCEARPAQSSMLEKAARSKRPVESIFSSITTFISILTLTGCATDQPTLIIPFTVPRLFAQPRAIPISDTAFALTSAIITGAGRIPLILAFVTRILSSSPWRENSFQHRSPHHVNALDASPVCITRSCRMWRFSLENSRGNGLSITVVCGEKATAATGPSAKCPYLKGARPGQISLCLRQDYGRLCV